MMLMIVMIQIGEQLELQDKYSNNNTHLGKKDKKDKASLIEV